MLIDLTEEWEEIKRVAQMRTLAITRNTGNISLILHE
jgi:hypothetical protein